MKKYGSKLAYIEEKKAQGLLLFSKAQYAESSNIFLEILSLEPDDAICKAHLGACFLALKKWDEALTLLEFATSAFGAEDYRWWDMLADTYAGLNRQLDAIAALEQSLKLVKHPVTYGKIEYYIRTFFSDGKSPLDFIAEIAKKDFCDLPFSWVCIAINAAFCLNNESLQKRLIEYGLNNFIDEPVLHITIGKNYEKKRERALAISAYEQACLLCPKMPEYHALLGMMHCDEGTFALALPALKEALRLYDGDPEWWIFYARALYHTDDLEEALTAYGRSLNIQEKENIRDVYNNLKIIIAEGGKDFPASFYDKVFATSAVYLTDRHLNYEVIWDKIAEYLKQHTVQTVLDLGCGPGQLCHFLLERLPSLQYTGLDFSKIAIENGQKRCPNAYFRVEELPLKDFAPYMPVDIIICTEVLEHITKDLDIMSSIPSKQRVAITVPSYDSSTHVRFFVNEEQVYERYASFFQEGFTIEKINISKENAIWLLCGLKK